MGLSARVRHEPDRTYTVLVTGPDGEVEVGRTAFTRELQALAGPGVPLHVPMPPYGRDGQWVRVLEDGSFGQAHWFPAEGAWFVTVAGSGTGIHPSEDLDFAPEVTDQAGDS